MVTYKARSRSPEDSRGNASGEGNDGSKRKRPGRVKHAVLTSVDAIDFATVAWRPVALRGQLLQPADRLLKSLHQALHVGHSATIGTQRPRERREDAQTDSAAGHALKAPTARRTGMHIRRVCETHMLILMFAQRFLNYKTQTPFPP